MNIDSIKIKVDDYTKEKADHLSEESDLMLEKEKADTLFDSYPDADAQVSAAFLEIQNEFALERARLEEQKKQLEEMRKSLLDQVGSERKKTDQAVAKLDAVKGMRYADKVDNAARKGHDVVTQLEEMLRELEGDGGSSDAGMGAGAGRHPVISDHRVSPDTGQDAVPAQEKEPGNNSFSGTYTNSKQRAEEGALQVPLHSDLTDALVSRLPGRRQAAVHTAYANAPAYIVDLINQHSYKLSGIKSTGYATDEYGHYILNKYGMRVRESCHYSPSQKHIAMHDHMTDAEYADVLQHELGHFIDDALGMASDSAVFQQAFADTVAKFDRNSVEGKQRLKDMLDDAFSTGAAFDRNVTDIISALTKNQPTVIHRFYDEDVSYYSHDNDYWNTLNWDGSDAGMCQKDSFANLFAIETGRYRISVNFVERWFPELADAMKQSVGGK